MKKEESKARPKTKTRTRSKTRRSILLLTIFFWIVSVLVPVPKSLAGRSLISEALADSRDLYSISPGSVDKPDIVWSRVIAVVKEKLTISARVRGKGKHPVEVRFILEAPDLPKVTLPAKLVPQKEGEKEYADYQASWQPGQAEIYQLTVQVDPAKKSRDQVRKNNTATVILPVVWKELHVIAWGPTKHMKWLTGVAQQFPRGREDVIPELPYWNRRGIKVLGFMYTHEATWMERKDAEKLIKAIVGQAGRYSAAGCQGLIIDETGSYRTPEGLEFIRRFGLAYDRIREKYPHLQVYNWISGPLHPEEIEIGRRNRHIVMGESYEAIHSRSAPDWISFLERRVERLIGHESFAPNAIIALGTGSDCGRRFWPQIEDSVRLCRKLGPGMPGIQYYQTKYLKEGEAYEGSFLEFLDRLTFEYFIKPVLVVRENDIWASDYSPRRKESVSLQVRLHNIGGIPAKKVRAKVYARHLESGKRSLLINTLVPQIGNGYEDIIEEKVTSIDHKVIKGTKHPIRRTDKRTGVMLNRALVDTTWKPSGSGYYQIEVELEPSNQYTILEGRAEKTIIVGK